MVHWIVPFAGIPAAWSQAGLLPPQWRPAQLAAWVKARPTVPEALLAGLPGPDACTDPELSLTPPHERALAQAVGLCAGAGLQDGQVPLAGLEAAQAGHGGDGRAWGRLTLAHWHLGTEQVTMRDPAELGLSEPESRAFLDTLRPWFEEDGWQIEWRTPTRWLVSHPDLDGLPCASLDRVIGRNVDLWLAADPRARRIRRLQNEVQMLLHAHPLNEEREARGALAVNSFWLDGCGPVPGLAVLGRLDHVRLDERLREPALRGDVVAWCQAFDALDQEVIGPVRAAALQGEDVQLSLCGERSIWTLAKPGGAAPWQRLWSWWRPDAAHHRLLKTLQAL
jgi:hypothetical protein